MTSDINQQGLEIDFDMELDVSQPRQCLSISTQRCLVARKQTAYWYRQDGEEAKENYRLWQNRWEGCEQVQRQLKEQLGVYFRWPQRTAPTVASLQPSEDDIKLIRNLYLVHFKNFIKLPLGSLGPPRHIPLMRYGRPDVRDVIGLYLSGQFVDPAAWQDQRYSRFRQKITSCREIYIRLPPGSLLENDYETHHRVLKTCILEAIESLVHKRELNGDMSEFNESDRGLCVLIELGWMTHVPHLVIIDGVEDAFLGSDKSNRCNGRLGFLNLTGGILPEWLRHDVFFVLVACGSLLDPCHEDRRECAGAEMRRKYILKPVDT